jgi:uncharacterized protein YndB with AHSA1/START domain
VPTESFEITHTLPASPEAIFRAWVDPAEHARFTCSPASGESTVGGRFTAWDGYILGSHRVLEPGRRIVQSWRTVEFPDDAPDSELELVLEASEGGTQILLRHRDVPEGQGDAYRAGWVDHYFAPLARFFSTPPKLKDREQAQAMPSKKPAPRKAAPQKGAAKKAAPKKVAPKGSAKNRAAPRKALPKKAAPKKGAKKAARKAASPSRKAPARKAAPRRAAKVKAKSRAPASRSKGPAKATRSAKRSRR